MKNGQVQHIFIYILTIVIVGLILLMGYKVIGNTINQGCEVEHATFTSQILGLIEKYDTFGSFHVEDIAAPCDFEKICFVDKTSFGTNIDSGYAIMDNSVKDGIEKNIFLIGETTEPVGYVEKLEVADPYYVCINSTAGQFKVGFRGTGKTTQIEAVS